MDLPNGKVMLWLFSTAFLCLSGLPGCEGTRAQNLTRLSKAMGSVSETQRHDNPNIYVDLLRKYDAERTLIGLEEWELRKILFKTDIDPIQASFSDPEHISSKSLCFSVVPAQQLLVSLVDGRVTEVEFQMEGW